MGFVNVEIKARSENNESIRKTLLEKKADYRGKDHQIDTYYKVANGRLKLREGNIENNLIHYNRTNQAGPKQSLVSLYTFAPEGNLKEVLSNALEVLVTVDKEREIYFIDNVKFHLDTVKGLGTFMEIEAIDYEGNRGEKELLELCQGYMKLLSVDETDLLATSYSDLLLEAGLPGKA